MQQQKDTAREEIEAPRAASPQQTLAALSLSDDDGLDDAEIGRRRSRYGPNRMHQARPRSAGRVLINQFKNAVV